MTDLRQETGTGDTARSVFAGLAPTTPGTSTARAASERAAGLERGAHNRRRVRQGVMSTMPIVLAGAMVGLNLTGPIDTATAAPKRPSTPKSELSPTARAAIELAAAQAAEAALAAAAAQASLPSTYVVQSGDTVSGIAARYGVSTASVLALNGLGWKSLIFPGQTLKLSGAAASTAAPVGQRPAAYTIKRGDTISGIAERYGVTTASLLSLNGLTRSSIIYPGQTISLGGSSIDIQPVSSVTPGAGTPGAGDPPSTPPTSAPATI
ncbi:MAG: LysM peptidoglycan-binding domain-containing protein, partial [Pseudolysinimonas sp.]